MSTGSNPNQNTEFLNFSDALHHARWGEKLARRVWHGEYYVVVYGNGSPYLEKRNGWNDRPMSTNVGGTDLMAEDWYVLGAHQ